MCTAVEVGARRVEGGAGMTCNDLTDSAAKACWQFGEEKTAEPHGVGGVKIRMISIECRS